VDSAAGRDGLATGAWLGRTGLAVARPELTPLPASSRQLVQELVDARRQLQRYGTLLNQAVARLHSTGRRWSWGRRRLGVSGRCCGCSRPRWRGMWRRTRLAVVGGGDRSGVPRRPGHWTGAVPVWPGPDGVQRAARRPAPGGVLARRRPGDAGGVGAGPDPGRQVGWGLDVEHLVRALEMPLGFPDRPVRDPVWHCTLRNADGDRALSDAESGQVAADVMHRTGWPPPARTVAVRGSRSGTMRCRSTWSRCSPRRTAARVRLWNDFLRLREGCLAAERRYGLTVTAPADRTAATHTTRGERERRRGPAGVRRLGTGCVARSGWLRSPPAATPSSWTGCGRPGWR